MDYDGFLELVKARRSTRSFKPDPVPDDYVDRIVEAGRWAPSGFNQQPWEFVVVKDPRLRESIVRICKAHMELNAQMEATREEWQNSAKPPRPPEEGGDFSVAPVYILLLGDTRTRKGLPMARRCDHEQYRLAFISGLASAFLYMHLAAATLGLGSQWVSRVSTPYGNCMVRNLLGIPEEMEVCDMMVLGYPASTPGARLMREKDKMVHYDYCGPEAFRSDHEVNGFIKRSRE
ncbi:MAG: nitroreductase family protein [Syntrophorhabdales bacterium]